jgi:hypothetical protein
MFRHERFPGRNVLSVRQDIAHSPRRLAARSDSAMGDSQNFRNARFEIVITRAGVPKGAKEAKSNKIVFKAGNSHTYRAVFAKTAIRCYSSSTYFMKLNSTLLNLASEAVLHHGYGTFFPVPPELAIVVKHWHKIESELANVDLDTYSGHDPIYSFAPKSRLNVRRVALIHPYDFILYTALVLALKSSISKSRLKADRVFSYRTEMTSPSHLYASVSAWREFRSVVEQRVAAKPSCIVGVTDIADFFPRIYHHRLYNALQVCCDKSERDFVRVLDKMLFRFSEGTSYGIPVGPPASRLLAEAVLSDVDRVLLSHGIDFVRFVDDYIIFADRAEDAEYGIRVLGETLFQFHGLTLQTAKTKVSSGKDYIDKNLTVHSEKEQNRLKLMEVFEFSEYEVTSYEDLKEEQKKEINAYNLGGMLQEALLEGANVDYREVQFILGRLAALRKPELIPIVLDNLERLYPVAESVAAFFIKFAALPATDCESIASALLAPILSPLEARPSEYYSMWILSIFESGGNWNHAEDLLRIFQQTNSDVVRRFAALALSQSGTRAQAFALKNYLASGSPLSRTAILLASAKLGEDERQHFAKGLKLTDSLEQACIRET